jgi:hypothetical protein
VLALVILPLIFLSATIAFTTTVLKILNTGSVRSILTLTFYELLYNDGTERLMFESPLDAFFNCIETYVPK